MLEIVLASRNAHKIAELEKILGNKLPHIKVSGDSGPEPVENGTTFAANALIKAHVAAQRTGKIALADDSGIAVDILGGCPGIFSARWAGPAKNDRDNLELLLWQLSDVPSQHRSAAFVCAAAAVIPETRGEFTELVAVAKWEGKILTKPQGINGFGYDPIFQPQGFEISAAELDPQQKNEISHRNLAFTELAQQLSKVL